MQGFVSECNERLSCNDHVTEQICGTGATLWSTSIGPVEVATFATLLACHTAANRRAQLWLRLHLRRRAGSMTAAAISSWSEGPSHPPTSPSSAPPPVLLRAEPALCAGQGMRHLWSLPSRVSASPSHLRGLRRLPIFDCASTGGQLRHGLGTWYDGLHTTPGRDHLRPASASKAWAIKCSHFRWQTALGG